MIARGYAQSYCYYYIMKGAAHNGPAFSMLMGKRKPAQKLRRAAGSKPAARYIFCQIIK